MNTRSTARVHPPDDRLVALAVACVLASACQQPPALPSCPQGFELTAQRSAPTPLGFFGAGPHGEWHSDDAGWQFHDWDLVATGPVVKEVGAIGFGASDDSAIFWSETLDLLQAVRVRPNGTRETLGTAKVKGGGRLLGEIEGGVLAGAGHAQVDGGILLFKLKRGAEEHFALPTTQFPTASVELGWTNLVATKAHDLVEVWPLESGSAPFTAPDDDPANSVLARCDETTAFLATMHPTADGGTVQGFAWLDAHATPRFPPGEVQVTRTYFASALCTGDRALVVSSADSDLELAEFSAGTFVRRQRLGLPDGGAGVWSAQLRLDGDRLRLAWAQFDGTFSIQAGTLTCRK